MLVIFFRLDLIKKIEEFGQIQIKEALKQKVESKVIEVRKEKGKELERNFKKGAGNFESKDSQGRSRKGKRRKGRKRK